MDDQLKHALRDLATRRAVAALGTVDKGEPFVSMVPFILHGRGPDFLIHVSALSAHTRHMTLNPRVSLMVMAGEDDRNEQGEPIAPQALPRITIQGEARRIDPQSGEYDAGRTAYLQRFPDASVTFELPDFSLFSIMPASVRFIAGFGKAHSLTAAAWAEVFASA